jgi:hypothetical protein
MTGIELPIYALIGVLGTAAGAGGAWAATKKQATDNRETIKDLHAEFDDHTKADARAFNEIMRSLGRIEGTLQELKRNNT